MKKLVLLLSLALTLAFGTALEEAHTAYKEKKYDVAIPIYEEFANQGNADAQFYLGSLYRSGKGVEKDLNKAVYWLDKMDLQNVRHYGAYFALYGLTNERYSPEIDYNIPAEDHTQKLALNGDPKAQYEIGLIYYEGEKHYNNEKIKQDYIKALEWFEKVANQGSIYTQHNLGVMYEENQDYLKAKEWYEKSCQGGFQRACEKLK